MEDRHALPVPTQRRLDRHLPRSSAPTSAASPVTADLAAVSVEPVELLTSLLSLTTNKLK
jgi:hypothetical protein